MLFHTIIKMQDSVEATALGIISATLNCQAERRNKTKQVTTC